MKILKWLIKAFVAGCIAFALLCAFCLLWYNVPVHYDNPSGATEYVWESRKFYSKGTEGFALGRTNNEGFNNIKDYNEGDEIDILLMGSSHMEGFNVAQDENAAAVINQLFFTEVHAESFENEVFLRLVSVQCGGKIAYAVEQGMACGADVVAVFFALKELVYHGCGIFILSHIEALHMA